MPKFVFLYFLALLNLCFSSEKYNAVDLSYSSYSPPGEPQALVSPILILHGLLGSKSNWNSLSKTIAEKTNRQVFTLDARNHGESPHSVEFTYNHMVVDTVKFMTKQQLKKAILIGHSLGGKTSMLLSLLHPELVESLIIVDISPRGVSPGFDDIPKYVEALMDTQLPSGVTLYQARKQVTEQLKKYIEDPGLVQFLLTNLVEEKPKKFKWRINLETIYKSFDHIGGFDCDIGNVYRGSTLFIGGGNSDYIRKDNHELIKKLFPSAEIKYIPGAGHWVHAEKPTEFLSMTVDFINNH